MRPRIWCGLTQLGRLRLLGLFIFFQKYGGVRYERGG